MMLMLFEGVMCHQRQNSVLMMRNMRRPPYKIFVFRAGKWMFHNTDTIFPGDIVSLTADQTIYPSGKKF
jgi:magnesium-transporting ATPase (P-type)